MLFFMVRPGLEKRRWHPLLQMKWAVNVRITSGPAITHAGDVAAILTNLAPGDVLFIDEIHRLNANVEEVLYPAMEDFALDIMIGKGPSARSVRLDLNKFTLVGATTRMGLLTSPLRDRFGIKEQMEMYRPEDLKLIVDRSAQILNIKIEDDGGDRACVALPRDAAYRESAFAACAGLCGSGWRRCRGP